METGIFMRGEVFDLYKAPDFTSKETGEITEGRNKVTILVREHLSNGDKKPKFHYLSCHDVQAFDALKGKVVDVMVGATTAGKDIIYFIPKGVKPQAVKADLHKVA